MKPPACLDAHGATGVARAALDVEIESDFLTAVGGRTDGGFGLTAPLGGERRRLLLVDEIRAAIAAANMERFVPLLEPYVWVPVPDGVCVVVPPSEVKPPARNPRVRGIDPERAASILTAIQRGEPLPPIEVHVPNGIAAPYRYEVHDGFRRFHLSVARSVSRRCQSSSSGPSAGRT
ncbi:hypothetical protein [Zeimonas arvi]|uniref:ParB/Sulfiredoxin domain-containing protein n=1 Tax=Zeimonas arvi TaxID=2498847 RepID=A0A5C8P0Y2_9BURK|nr:hypothetical protein [Zeimonas arvi]TXL67255.1 hypothetical protein FHP08_06505 [Zeimonas arvi]